MGAAAAKAWEQVLGRRERRVVMYGLDAAGKTTLLYRLRLGELVAVIPTIGFNVESVEHKMQTFTFWDLGLRDKARPLLRHYLKPPPDAMVFVVDANDRERLDEAQSFMEFGLQALCDEADDFSSAPPLLVFVNKVDLPRAMPCEQVLAGLRLESMMQQGLRVHLQSCCATSGEGLYEGLEWLDASIRGRANARTAPSTCLNIPTPSASGAAPTVTSDGAFGDDDDAFLRTFDRGELPSCGVNELLRAAYLHRTRVPGASARVTFEVAKQLGYITHATRAYFWIARAYQMLLVDASTASGSFAAFLEANEQVLPTSPAEQEAIILQSYSSHSLEADLAARVLVPPDLAADDERWLGREVDADFLKRVEDGKFLEDEFSSFRDAVRLAFALLQRCPRAEAIKRADALYRRLAESGRPSRMAAGRSTRPYHETQQYVALQLAHAALASRPELQHVEFSELEAACPQILTEDAISRYYSSSKLAGGKDAFVVPDLQPLPSVIAVRKQTWHEELDDAAFLAVLRAGSLEPLGVLCLVRCAYLFLRQGRRPAIAALLVEVENSREQASALPGLFAHETLAYFTLHMVHYTVASLKWPMDQPFSDFAARARHLLDPLLYRQYYSDGLLHCPEARGGLVLPDLQPFPSLVHKSVE